MRSPPCYCVRRQVSSAPQQPQVCRRPCRASGAEPPPTPHQALTGEINIAQYIEPRPNYAPEWRRSRGRPHAWRPWDVCSKGECLSLPPLLHPLGQPRLDQPTDSAPRSDISFTVISKLEVSGRRRWLRAAPATCHGAIPQSIFNLLQTLPRCRCASPRPDGCIRPRLLRNTTL